LFHCVSENRREIKNGQSRDTGYIEYTRHRAETNKSEKHNKKTKNDEHHGPHENLVFLKMKIKHSFQINSLLKMIFPPLLGELFCGGKN
jgi:hypothetical protein